MYLPIRRLSNQHAFIFVTTSFILHPSWADMSFRYVNIIGAELLKISHSFITR